MQSLHFRSCKARTRSRRTRNIESFRILIDLILWQNLIKIERFESAFFVSMYIFLIDFSIIFSFSHLIDISYELSTVNSHRYWIIDVARSIWELWDTMMLSRSWCDLHSRQYRILKHKILVSWCMFYSILDINFHIDVSLHEDAYLERRNFSNIRSHVLQIDSTSYLKSTNHRISIRSFLQFSHRCII